MKTGNAKRKNKRASVICPYCEGPARYFARSSHIYNGRDYGPVYHCVQCDAYVGCHPDGSPKGTPADYETREARKRAHAAFDAIWQSGKVRRDAAYYALAKALFITRSTCHIGMFDVELANAVVVTVADWERDGHDFTMPAREPRPHITEPRVAFEQRTIQCRFCEKRVATTESLRQHMKVKHPGKGIQ